MCFYPSGNLLSAATVESGPKERKHQDGCVLVGPGEGAEASLLFSQVCCGWGAGRGQRVPFPGGKARSQASRHNSALAAHSWVLHLFRHKYIPNRTSRGKWTVLWCEPSTVYSSEDIFTLKTSEMRHTSSVYLDTSKHTFLVLLSVKRCSDVNFKASCKSIWHFSMFFWHLNRMQ